MTFDNQRAHTCWQLMDEVRGLLDQGWFYTGSPPGRDLSERRVTECSDLLGLVAELCGDCQRMADAIDGLIARAVEADITPTLLRKLVGTDLVALSKAHKTLAEDLAAAGNRALDVIGENYDGTQRQQFRAQDTESQRVCGG